MADRARAELLVGVAGKRILIKLDAEAGRGRQGQVAVLRDERTARNLLADRLEVDEVLGDEEVRDRRAESAAVAARPTVVLL